MNRQRWAREGRLCRYSSLRVCNKIDLHVLALWSVRGCDRGIKRGAASTAAPASSSASRHSKGGRARIRHRADLRQARVGWEHEGPSPR